PLPAQGAIYDGFEVLDEKGQPLPAAVDGGNAHWAVTLPAGARHVFTVRYRTRGTSSWTYRPAASGGSVIREFSVELRSNGRGIDFPPGSISPSHAASEGAGWRGVWEFRSLVGSAPISLQLPQKTNPGPLAARITFFAPVALLFYFFVVGLLAEGRGHRLHPLSWFLIGCAFFADHLLFAYLADHVPLWVALALSSAVSILLAVTYAQWLVGWRFAIREVGLAQLGYLVGVSPPLPPGGLPGPRITR